MVDQAENNKVPARNAPNSDQEPQRSRGPADRPAPPHRDKMNRKTAPGRDAAAPSSPAPVANDLGIFLCVLRIKFAKLASAHRLYRLQGLFLQQLANSRILEPFVENGHDLVDDRLRGAAWDCEAIPRHDIDLGISRLAYGRDIRQKRRTRGAEYG